MSYNIVYTDCFEKEAKYLTKKYHSFKYDLLALIGSLAENPEQGVALGNNLYKIRLAIKEKGRGKSGGARVITYVLITENTVFLTSVYDKAEKSSVNTRLLLKILKEEGLIK